uniref:Integrin alpha-2 domain-containing protein n=1 Tax=Gasterosteus aculeatus aculeatus TaxID=481459 RepID=A0AAQ4QTB2_GASAC
MAPGVVALLSVWVGVCAAFNLDTAFSLLKKGGDGSLFGLSVALHQDLRKGSYLLLVGAPREKAETNVPANRTGGVYSCPITADQSECSRMQLIDPDVNLSEDLIEDMWLGASVASQGRPGGRVLVCGHRFVKLYGALKLRHMIGRCYLRGNDLQYNDTDIHWQNPDQPCSHLGDISSEVMCNVGISASITQTEVIVGSPGSYEWQGNVHISWMNPHVVFDTQRSFFPNLQHRNIYTGYSVTQAHRLLSQDDETIVTGAPKDSKDDARGSVLLAVKQSDKLTTQQTLRGEQTGSYFGNAVATTDLNNDGWNDLLVGAPFYFQRQQEAGGAVYVYMNRGGWFDSRPSVVLRGPSGSAFGMAVAAAGDLNQDGFQDFAIGAPFHETGSVMIWLGSHVGASTQPSQVILGSRVSPVFRTFGYSLSGGVDVDGNKYPDLLVGSLDDTVALLRTRPVIHLNKTIKVSPDVVDPNSCDFCIQVEVCFSYMFSTGDQSDRDNVTIHFAIRADVTGTKSRLLFRGNGESVYSGFLSMPNKRCDTLRVTLVSPIRDKVRPLVFSLNVSLYQKFPKKKNAVQDLKLLPVLSESPQPIRTQIHIQKYCGSDNRCHSNLQMTAQFTDQNQNPFPVQKGHQLLNYNDGLDRLLLEVNVTNKPSLGREAEDAHNAALNISIPSSLLYSGVRTKGDLQAVMECSVEDSVLLCELGNPFKSNRQVQVLIIFQASGISLDTRKIESLLQLSTFSEQTDLSPVFLSMLVEYSLQTSLTLINPPGPASFRGHVTGESAMEETPDVGSLLLFTFQLPKEERRRRSLEDQVDKNKKQRGRILPLFHQMKISYILDCFHGAKCVTFVCPLTNMKNTATVTLKARLWNSTMMEDYSDAHSVLVRGRATLKLQTSKPTINMKPQSTEIEVHIHPDPGQQWVSRAPMWILVVSVLAGVSLMALICLLLWKCGFFVHQSAWGTTALHQGRIMSKHERQQQQLQFQDFLIQDQVSSSRKSTKNWVTSWTETN